MRDNLPRCSIVVPTYRRQDQLAACLGSLAALDYPADRYEILVVDDGGDAPLDEIVEIGRARVATTLLRQPRQGPAAARNLGAARAGGELIAFTDDDCRPTPRWLRALADAHVRAPQLAVGGHTRNALTGNPFSITSQMIIDAGYDWHNADRGDARFMASNNFAFPAAGFHEIGGFDPTFRTSEDRDLCDRWVAAGRRMRYVPDAVVEHHHELTLRGFCRQHFGYGRGARRFHRAFAERSGRRIRIEPSFYAGLHRRGWRQPGVGRKLQIQAALAIWHVVNLAGYLHQGWTAAKEAR